MVIDVATVLGQDYHCAVRRSACRWSWRMASIAAIIAIAGCSDDVAAPPGGAGGTGGAGGADACPASTVPFESGCRPEYASDCPAGTMPVLGDPACVPVGWHECPAPFVAAQWGCADGLGPEPCTGASRDAIGGACVPIGDCDAPFPPARATLFVDDSYAPAELDATHFASIGAALAAAAPSDVIAVESGTYVEALSLRDAVSVVGRCAAEVRLESPGGTPPGLYHDDGSEVEVRGLTITGHRGGAVALGGRLRIVESLLEQNREIGVIVADPTGVLALERSVVRDTPPTASGILGRGVDVEVGGRIEIVESAVVLSREVAVLITDPGSSGVITDSVIRSTLPDGAGLNGRGVVVRSDALLTIARSAVVDNHDVGVFASGAQSLLLIDETVVRGTEVDTAGEFGRGVSAISGARIEVRRSALIENRSGGLVIEGDGSSLLLEDSSVARNLPAADGTFGVGLFARPGTSVVVNRTAFVENTDFGVVADGSSLSMSDSLVRSTRPTPAGAHGDGVLSFAGGSLDLAGSAVIDHRGTGVFVSLDGATARVTNTIVEGVQPTEDTGVFGFGMLASHGRLDVTGSSVTGASSAGIAFDRSSGVVAASTVWNNTVGLHVQNGTAVIEVAASGEPSPLEVLLTADTTFVGNDQRFGSDVLPIPSLEGLFDDAP